MALPALGLGLLSGGKGAWALAAAPMVMQALSELNNGSASGGENMAATGGQLTGALGLGALGAAVTPSGRWRPAGFALGSMLGGFGGAGLARNVTRAITNPSPADEQADLMRKMARAQLDVANTLLPAERDRVLLAYQDAERRALLQSRLNGVAAYQQGLTAGALSPPSVFQDGGVTSLAASLGGSVFG